MSLPRSAVDSFLIDWDEGEYEAQVKSMGQKSERIEPKVPAVRLRGGNARKAKTTAERAQAVRDRLARTVRKVPEVMVKITSSSKGMKQIGRLRWTPSVGQKVG